MRLTLTPPWLIADLGRPRRVLSFAPHNPGFHRARHILLREVRNADLPQGLDPHRWLAGQVQGIGQAQSVCMMTSRPLRHYRVSRVGPVCCLATVGLGNAERVGHRRAVPAAAPQPQPQPGYGTINLAILLAEGLTDTAMIEALTIAAQARTLAVLEAGIMLPSGLATGTGTDCIALACDAGATGFAGLHTPLGEALGRAVHDAVLAGARDWVAAHGRIPPPTPGGA
ncbi:MAG TPA: adenosylcobinamide amidohydrolase [Paracoccus solventivorans]|uniref:adenosylcobinamide amidohydrolase n=1 Tax=Paracoccus solventivorans TaxID=53463 RepID=UPI002C0B6730|nr:adenosylcobinamide amidohydrolase [Paracoccus solventivorans]HMM09079.1 adenosylcobinamide amidohydrolase [Paracoccus solventivorans]